MSLIFYLAGVFSGYIAWRMASAPYLWDALDEAKMWRNKWHELYEKHSEKNND